MTTFILPFEKMHGLGNDFIVLEKRHLPNNVNEKILAKILCNRNYAIGADGLIIVDLSPSREADFSWNYYNSDGSEAEMCGNGMRCFVKYVYEKGFTDSVEISVLTKAGIIKNKIEQDSTVTVNMGKPKYDTDEKNVLLVDDQELRYTYVEVGNPHCVIFVKSPIGDKEFYKLGPAIEKHSRFSNGTNVEFAFLKSKIEIECKVWERGCGPTLACGTGACAVLVASVVNKLSDDSVKISLPGGIVRVRWDKKDDNLYLNGSATSVYIGQFNLDPFLVCAN